jgi:hypothetical protein
LAFLTLVGVRFRKAFPLSLLALLPDFDVLFHVHRSFSHSIIVYLILFILASPFIWKFKSYRPVLLAFLILASHPILDMFEGYTPILWPLYKQSLWISAESIVHVGSLPNLSFGLEVFAKPTVFTYAESFDAPLFTSEGLIISTLLFIAVIMGNVRLRKA